MNKYEGMNTNWSIAALKDVCEINPRKMIPAAALQSTFNFVPMSAVVEEFGGIDTSQLRPFADVQKGYTQFQVNDVLFAKSST